MVVQHEQPFGSSPSTRAGARNSITKAAAIRRGEIKISHPIPIPDTYEGGPPAGGGASPMTSGVPLKDVRPAQPPQSDIPLDGRPTTRRKVYTSAGNEPNGADGSKGDLRASQHPRGAKSVEALPVQAPFQQTASTTVTAPVAPHPPRLLSQKRSSILKRGSPTDKRVSSVMNQDSLRSSYDASGDEKGSDSKEKRRGSGSLRGVFRKIFGGGSKKEKDDGGSRKIVSRGQDIHEGEEWTAPQNDSVARSNTVANMDHYAAEQNKALTKLPISEIVGRDPLRSHLPFPMNVNAPETSPRHEWPPEPSFDHLDSPVRPPKRRATLPSLVLSEAEVKDLAALWNSNNKDGDMFKRKSPTPDIGLALTSSGAYNSKRRSRSADALNEMVKEHEMMETGNGEPRRRSRAEEIAYWRSSQQLGTETRDFAPVQEQSYERPERGDSSSEASMKTANTVPPEVRTYHHHVSTEDEEDDDDSIQRRTPPNERDSFERPSPEALRASLPFGPSRVNHSTLTSPTNADQQVYTNHMRNFSRPVVDSVNKDHLEERLSRLETWMQNVRTSRNFSNLTINPTAPVSHEREGGAFPEDVNDRRDLQTDLASTEWNSSAMAPIYERSNIEQSPSTQIESSPRTPVPDNLNTTAYSLSEQTNPSDSGFESLHSIQSRAASKPSSEFANQQQQPPQQPPSAYSRQFSPQNRQSAQLAAAHGEMLNQPTTISHQSPESSSLPSPNIYEYLAPLYSALRYERSKRKEFEVQMRQMRQEIHDLRSYLRDYPPERSWDGGAQRGMNRQYMHGGAAQAYSTPSPEDGFGDSAGSFDSGTDNEKGRTRRRLDPSFDPERQQELHQSRFSGLDYDSSDNEGGAGAGANVDEDVFRTPKESAGFHFPLAQQAADWSANAATGGQQSGRSRIPTPKSSVKNMRAQQQQQQQGPVPAPPAPAPGPTPASAQSVSSKASMGSIGTKNRFGFSGGKW